MYAIMGVLMLLLDWSKAFDRIDSTALMVALKRFGIPQPFVRMVEAIYTGRRFSVRDSGQESQSYPQCSGISQGCPLSPFLFVILMTVLLYDVDSDGGAQSDSLPLTRTRSSEH